MHAAHSLNPYRAAYNPSLALYSPDPNLDRAPLPTAQVRCCSDTYRVGWKKSPGCSVWGESDVPLPPSFAPGCARDKNFAQAKAICQAVAGARLCTVAELEGSCTAGSGCLFDKELIWAVPGPSLM